MEPISDNPPNFPWLKSTVKVTSGSTTTDITNSTLECLVERSIGIKLGNFDIKLDNTNGQFNNIVFAGSTIEVWADRSDGSTVKIMKGIIDERAIKLVPPQENYMNLHGRDFSELLEEITVQVESYPANTEVSYIVNDLRRKYTPVIGSGSIQGTAKTFDRFDVDYKPLNMVLQELSELSSFDYFVDVTGSLQWFPAGASGGSITLTENDIVEAEITEDITYIKNEIFVLGGESINLDQQQNLTGSTKNIDNVWLAAPVIVTKPILSHIDFHLVPVGTPLFKFVYGRVFVDDGSNTPQSAQLVAAFRTNDVTTGSGWYSAPIQVDLTHVHPSTPVGTFRIWVALQNDATSGSNNYYAWSHDNNITGSFATGSSDGVTWTVFSTTGSLAVKTYSSETVATVNQDPISIAAFYKRSLVFKDDKIKDKNIAKDIALAKINNLGSLRKKGKVRIVAPSQAVVPGDLASITLTGAGITSHDYKVIQVRYKLNPKGFSGYVDLVIGEEVKGIVEELRNVTATLKRTSMEKARGTAIVQRLEGTVAVQAILNKRIQQYQPTGTFVYGNRKDGTITP